MLFSIKVFAVFTVCNEKITPYFKRCASNISNLSTKPLSNDPFTCEINGSIDDAQRQIAQNFRYTQEHPLTETKKYNNFVRGAKDVCSEDNVTEIKELIIED